VQLQLNSHRSAVPPEGARLVHSSHLGDALDWKGQYAQREIRAESVGRRVKERPRARAALDGLPAELDTRELLAAERQMLGGQRVVVCEPRKV